MDQNKPIGTTNHQMAYLNQDHLFESELLRTMKHCYFQHARRFQGNCRSIRIRTPFKFATTRLYRHV